MESKPRKLRDLLLLSAAVVALAVPFAVLATPTPASAQTVVANVVALDQVLVYNRLGSFNPAGMIYALRRDVVHHSGNAGCEDLAAVDGLTELASRRPLRAGCVRLRDDKRPRPLTLRANEGDTLTIIFQNLLNPNPQTNVDNQPGGVQLSNIQSEQPHTRAAGVHIHGMQLISRIQFDGSNVGQNGTSLASPGQRRVYSVFAEKEGCYLIDSAAATLGGEGGSGSKASGLFGSLNVEPPGAVWYRSQITRAEMELAKTGDTPAGQPVLDYNATYPAASTDPRLADLAAAGIIPSDYFQKYIQNLGKAGLPILKILGGARGSEIVHNEINAIIAGDGPNGFWSNTALPATRPGADRSGGGVNRAEPFREFTIVFHDEVKNVQAFPGFYGTQGTNSPLKFTLHGVQDKFAINYGTGGIGSEIIANRLGVGPMWDCPECKYEEFFLTSWAVGDPAMIVDVPASLNLETCAPTADGLGLSGDCTDVGPKATMSFFPDDPANVWHSYLNDRVKIRNLHVGTEHHIFHLHAHQWFFTPNASTGEANYLDAQAIGNGSSFTYEIAYTGSGNRNLTAGDSIFHCHLYPHFAQGMWGLWRVHDVFEMGTRLEVDSTLPLGHGLPAFEARALPDGELPSGSPVVGVVPMPGLAMAPMPGAEVRVVSRPPPVIGGTTADVGGSDVEIDGTGNPGFPFFIAAVAGHRPPTPPMDLVEDGGLPRHVIVSGSAASVQSPVSFFKQTTEATALWLPEAGTGVEQAAMAFHGPQTGAFGSRFHDSYLSDGVGTNPAGFEVNGLGPVEGAPFAEPCRTDVGGYAATVDGATKAGNVSYKAAVIQLDLQLNKVGWHFDQQRILALESDLDGNGAHSDPDRAHPLVMRGNIGDCIDFDHTNLVPGIYEGDDFQVETPTDVIGQHIHLVKFDVLSADGAANGWNYEDGTFSPDEVHERIEAIVHGGGIFAALDDGALTPGGLDPAQNKESTIVANKIGRQGVPYARTTRQRWYLDDGWSGNVFTHDHYGPSTHQQVGLYATLLIEPAGSVYKDNETGAEFRSAGHTGELTTNTWQAVIEYGGQAYREFYLEYGDFQLAYDAAGDPTKVSTTLSGGVPVTTITGGTARPINPSFRNDKNLPFLLKPQCPDGHPNAPAGPCPEAISAADPGTWVVNYRQEPVAQRIMTPGLEQAAGPAGDPAYAFQNRPRAITELNSQPTGSELTPDVDGTDPFTPILRAYDGDRVNLRIQVGAHEEMHITSINGFKWLQQYGIPASGWRDAQTLGISEQFQLQSPVLADVGGDGETDRLYLAHAAAGNGLWNGAWGLMRTYSTLQTDPETGDSTLAPLSTNSIGESARVIPNAGDFVGICPDLNGDDVLTKEDDNLRTYEVVAVKAADVLPDVSGDGLGDLVYNSRTSAHAANGIYDPTAILYFRKADVVFDGTTGLPTGLVPGTPVEPLILRAAAGDCVEVTLENHINGLAFAADPAFPGQTRDLTGFNVWAMIEERFGARALPGHLDASANGKGFNSNQVAPSERVGLHPQLLAYNVDQADGNTVGRNADSTVGPGGSITYRWYAGDARYDSGGNLVATPVEFGAVNLMSADRLKHSNKGAVGAMVVLPQDATWTEDADSRASATVTVGSETFRDFVVLHQTDINMRISANTLGAGAQPATPADWGGIGFPLPTVGGEEEPSDSGAKGVNYRAEPMWHRFGYNPATSQGALFSRSDWDRAFSNSLNGIGDPETPIFTAARGADVRFRLLQPGGSERSNLWTLHGHVWQRHPYVADSTEIGENDWSFWHGEQMGHGPAQHYDVVPANGAGGRFGTAGDFLYRGMTPVHAENGLWGLFRVQ